MDDVDRQLLNTMQNEFPICEEPFIKIGEKLGICEKEVLDRVNKLKSDGIIRRTGGVLDSKHLGYKSSLLALRVPPEDIEMVAEFINQFPGVTHNYQRSHTYNLWFTLSASSLEKFNQIVEIIKIKTGIHDILELPAINIFQHEVKFNF
jgi:DNA-binding Lrp family transcriptional regulator